jgi:hypothetical protein
MPSKLGRLDDTDTLRLTSRRILGGQPGHAPNSPYVETFWLPVLGPSTTWLIRLLNLRLERDGEDATLSIADAGYALGLGERPGRHSPLLRALGRAADFDLVMRALDRHAANPGGPVSDANEVALLVRRSLPTLPHRLVERLSPMLAREHHDFTIDTSVRLLAANHATEERCTTPGAPSALELVSMTAVTQDPT